MSPAVRVEPALLRAVRLHIPHADVGSEAAAWNHPDVHATPLAFYYDVETVDRYRETLKREPPELQHQVAQFIIAHHAHLSPVIVYEEQQHLAHVGSMADAAEAQAFLARAVKTMRLYSSALAHSLRAWIERMTPRQPVPLWADERLAAAWVVSHLRELQAGEPLSPPPGLDLFRASWLLAPGAEVKDYTLRQRGQALWLDAEDALPSTSEWESPGSLLCRLRASVPYIHVQQFEANHLVSDIPFQPVDQPIFLMPQTSLQLRTDYQEVVIDSIIRPEWAEVISRDAQGLFVAWQGETQRACWVNPGRYPVYDRTGRELGQLPMANGYWCRAEEALAQLHEGLRQPSWAEDYGLDAYGLYAGFRIGGIYQRMRWMVPGEFIMGSPEDEPERSDSETQHRVILSQGFWLADTACTQALWQAVMGDNPSRFQGEERPVENVSWDDVQDFLTRLNRAAPDSGFRMPTEAEWEYACRAGTTTAFWFGDQITPEEVNYDGNYPYADSAKGLYREETIPVKALPRNGWGLYQMHGNVWEWCQDWHGDYPAETVVDPTGPTEGGSRVLRGGDWLSYGRYARSAYRLHDGPGSRYINLGFQLARGQGASQVLPESVEEGQAGRAGETKRSEVE